MEEHEKAIAQTYELRKGLSCALLNAMESATYLYDAIANPSNIEITPTQTLAEIEQMQGQIRKTKSAEHRKELFNKLKLLKEKHKTEAVVVKPKVSPDIYRAFMSDFYGVWIASKDQMNKWARPLPEEVETESGMVTLPPTKDHLAWLFQEHLDRRPHFRLALQLFDDFLHSLKESGIYDLTVMEVPE